MYFFYRIAVGIIVLQFVSIIVAQNLECTIEQYEYAPNKWDQFCIFRSLVWNKGKPEPEFAGSNASKVAFVDCNLPSIPDSFFDRFPGLEILVMRNGTLETLKIKNRMKIVYAEQNQITKLLIEGSNTVLKELHIQENPLSSINTIVGSLKGLEVLDLSKTAVAEYNEGTIDLSQFGSLSNLTELYVTHMHAHYVENEIRSTLPKLKLLDLSGNPITPSNFDLEVFRTIPNLEELYLRDTIMTNLIVSDIRQDLPALKRLYLDGNSLRCDLLELLLAHFKEKDVETPTQSRKCHLGFDSIQGLCCLSYIKDVPRNKTQETVSQSSQDSETTTTTDTTRTQELDSNESSTTNEILLYVGVGIAVLVGVAIIAFLAYRLTKKHQLVPTHDSTPHDDL
ncbi:uncharacterized protein LOC128715315 [Anopheles marshallii]|uniref:uncharacterized protein LOC128715315 n=1 Tax=Anopheles marshallii TaxID=1521116 RepID=UPI00237BC7C2|nr:uncharacterized protein LOC128715315 [Anopheles marshallii]